jgi:signal-transduction protein with cAMP-binding, CBS, and nucleotidyltransferase domain
MNVSAICVRDVDLAKSNEPAWVAAERMHQRVVGCLVIVNEINQPIGILTDRDLVERVLAPGRDARDVLVAEVMTKEPMTICENASWRSALTTMKDGKCRRLAVVDAYGKLTGMVSMDDILMAIADELALMGSLLREESPAGVAAGI